MESVEESVNTLSPSLIPASVRVRYIKLGSAGSWEKECLDGAIIRIGFGTESTERLLLCQSSNWPGLVASFIAEGKDKGTATRFTNELRLFFEDDGTTLWITFMNERLYERSDLYERMFYVYHSGEPLSSDDSSIKIIDAEHLAELVVDAGLVNWLISKVS